VLELATLPTCRDILTIELRVEEVVQNEKGHLERRPFANIQLRSGQLCLNARPSRRVGIF
jgi:hypothetical protein